MIITTLLLPLGHISFSSGPDRPYAYYYARMVSHLTYGLYHICGRRMSISLTLAVLTFVNPPETTTYVQPSSTSITSTPRTAFGGRGCCHNYEANRSGGEASSQESRPTTLLGFPYVDRGFEPIPFPYQLKNMYAFIPSYIYRGEYCMVEIHKLSRAITK
jgi:hypothetical protein